MPVSRAMVAVVCAALIVAFAWWCWPAPDEADRVRAVVRAIVAGAEAGDVGDIMEPISPSFQGTEQGEPLDAGTLRAVLVGQILRRGPTVVVVGEIEVHVVGPTAHAAFDALIAEGSGRWTDVLPVNADGWHLEVDLALESDVWRVVGAERTRLSDVDAGTPR